MKRPHVLSIQCEDADGDTVETTNLYTTSNAQLHDDFLDHAMPAFDLFDGTVYWSEDGDDWFRVELVMTPKPRAYKGHLYPYVMRRATFTSRANARHLYVVLNRKCREQQYSAKARKVAGARKAV